MAPRPSHSPHSTPCHGTAAPASELVRRGHCLGDSDLRRRWVSADRTNEGMQARIGEELLEVPGGFPLVHDHDEAVTDPEAMVDRPDRLRAVRDLRELIRPVGESLTELGSVPLELRDGNNAHDLGPLPCPLMRAGAPLLE